MKDRQREGEKTREREREREREGEWLRHIFQYCRPNTREKMRANERQRQTQRDGEKMRERERKRVTVAYVSILRPKHKR